MATETQKQKNTKFKTTNDDNDASLIVFNDDYNTFDHVIGCFVSICKLDLNEAVEKTFYIHINGSGVVKNGNYDELKQMKNQLAENELKAIVQRSHLN